MELQRSWSRIWIYGTLAALLLPVVLFLISYAEFRLTGTKYVENFCRWIGIHEFIWRLFVSK
jgi:hypothetical protein